MFQNTCFPSPGNTEERTWEYQLTEVTEVSGVTDADGRMRLISWTQELNFQVLKKSSHVMQLQLSDFSRETLLVDLL